MDCDDNFSGASRIQGHPLHPQHPLTRLPHASGEFGCGVCSIQVDTAAPAFECEECGFGLDLDCALFTLPDGEGDLAPKEEEEEEELSVIRHPFDDHPLMSFYVKQQLPVPCRVCKVGIQGDACCCISCKFFLHRKCLDWPPEIKHPLHSQHSLSLFTADFVSCGICGPREPFQMAYGCSECDFYIDLGCAVNLDPVFTRKESSHGVRVLCTFHEDELLSFCAKAKASINCQICLSAILGEFLGCTDCGLYVHRGCVTAPERLQNPLHPRHPPMALYIGIVANGVCSSCSLSLENQLVYHCICGFSVHTECGRQTLANYEEEAVREIKLPWHDHPVFLCYEAVDFCRVCHHIIMDMEPSYSCKECHLFLHKSCLALDPEIDHPHHPNHRLYRVQESPFREPRNCSSCNERILGTHFFCKKCSFYLDMRCSSIFPTTKHELHQHKLTYLETNKVFSPCYRCGKDDHSAIFRCVPCNFNLHLDCSKLPPTVQHRSHWHPLTLHETYLEDDTGEYYCDVCEQPRNPINGVYVCEEECKAKGGFFAHIECVVPWVKLKSGLDSALFRVDGRISKLEEGVLEKKKELAALEDELEEARAERAAIISRSEEGGIL